MLCFLDFETRSEVDLLKYGSWAYTAHKTTEIICAAAKYDQYYAFNMFTEEGVSDFLKLIEHILSNGSLIVAHNAFFEYCVLLNILHKRKNFPEISYKNFRCTAAMSALSGLPRSLSAVCKSVGAEYKKDAVGNRLMLKMCKPRKPTKTDDSKWHETKEDISRLSEYCVRDVVATENIYPKLRKFGDELSVWLLDFKMNINGMFIDEDLVDKAINIVKESADFYNKEIIRITDGKLKNVNSRKQVLEWAFTQCNISLESFTKSYLEEYIKTDIPETLKQVLKIRLIMGKSSVSKLVLFKNMNCDNRLRGCFLYHGAFTGRWAGRHIQPQNLPRGAKNIDHIISDIKKLSPSDFINKYDNPLTSLSDIIRGVICAPQNTTLLVADYKAIESRVILWLAGDVAAMQKFKNNQDLYIEMASHIYNCEKDQVTADQRSLGKTAVLGLGYGMGIDKFVADCQSKNINIDRDFAETVVKKYREKYSIITKMWSAYEKAFKDCIKYKKYIFVGSVCFSLENVDDVIMTLPSNRKIIYRQCSLCKKDFFGKQIDQIMFKKVSDTTRQVITKTTWGGELVQNATQAVARDLISYAMLNLDSAGFKLTMTVHDEVVAEDDDPGRIDEFCRIMKQTPAWALGLPLDVEGWSDTRYHK